MAAMLADQDGDEMLLKNTAGGPNAMGGAPSGVTGVEGSTSPATTTRARAQLEEPVAVEEEEEDDEEIAEEKPEDEPYRESSRFKTWRKHLKDLYQTVMHFETRWESRTIEFLPQMKYVGNDCVELTLITGTNTGGLEQNYVELTSVVLPTRATLDQRVYDTDLQEIGGFGHAPSSVHARTTMRMFHDGNVLKARYMPTNPNVIATSSSDGNIYLFDKSSVLRTQKPNNPERRLLPRPEDPEVDSALTAEAKARHQERLKAFNEARRHQEMWDQQKGAGQQKLTLGGLPSPAYALDWDTTMTGKLAAGASTKVCVWEVAPLPKSVGRQQAALEPHWSTELRSEVNDIRWHWKDSNVFAAALETDGVVVQDTRHQSGSSGSLSCQDPSFHGTVSVDWAPAEPFSMAVGTHDGRVALFDVRQPNKMVSAYQVHKAGTEVPRVSFSPHARGVVASAGEDALVTLADFSTTEPTVLFRHSGHGGCVFDTQWCRNPTFAGMLVSVDETAAIVWKPRDAFWNTETQQQL